MKRKRKMKRKRMMKTRRNEYVVTGSEQELYKVLQQELIEGLETRFKIKGKIIKPDSIIIHLNEKIAWFSVKDGLI